MPRFDIYAQRAREYGLVVKLSQNTASIYADVRYRAFTNRGPATTDMTEDEAYWYLLGFLQGKMGTTLG